MPRMETLLVTGQGVHIKKKKTLLCIVQNGSTPPENRTTTISPLDINLIVLSGELSITSGALRLLASHDVGVVIMDGYGKPFGHFLPLEKGMIIENLERQKNMPPRKAFRAAQEIVWSAARNKAALLQAVGRSIGVDYRREVAGIRTEMKKMSAAAGSKELFGYEGTAGKIYFEGLRRALPPDFGFNGRNRHPPMDAINALLSYGYGILYSRIHGAVVSAGLSPYYGVLHSPYRKQEALVYDLVEEFRQPVVDRVVLTAVNQGRIRPDHFTCTPEGCIIEPRAKKIFSSAVLKRLYTEYSYMGGKEHFAGIIDRQARHFAGFVNGEHEYRAFRYK